MKKVTGLQKQGGKRMKGKIEYFDKELLGLVGKSGMNKILKDLEDARAQRANGFIGYLAEDVIEELKIIVENEINYHFRIEKW